MTVSAIRQEFWIPQIRRAVKIVLRDCTLCRRTCGLPYPSPSPTPLPFARVMDAPPLTAVGVDYTGAFILRGSKEEPKIDLNAYILFTCPSSRAIHLEVVDDLSTTSFLEAFRCFTSHHSLQSLILSDYASTFKSATRTFKSPSRSGVSQKFLTDRKIQRQFIPKRAPWYGGFILDP